MIYFNECRSEEVISFFWRSVYFLIGAQDHFRLGGGGGTFPPESLILARKSNVWAMHLCRKWGLGYPPPTVGTSFGFWVVIKPGFGTWVHFKV